MIQDVDESLRQMLASELAKIPGCPVRSLEQITFAPPPVAETGRGSGTLAGDSAEAAKGEKAETGSGKDGNGAIMPRGETDAAFPRLNLYLHDVRENLAMRDESYQLTRKPDENTVGIRPGPVRMDLSYLVTAYAGGDTTMEHRLLSDALNVLLRNTLIPVACLRGVFAGEKISVLLRVAQPDHPAHSDPPALWQSLGGRLRPALGLVVTAPFNPFETRWTKVVREAVIGMGMGTPPNGPQRPLELGSVRVSAAGVVVDQGNEKPLENAIIAARRHGAEANSEPEAQAATDSRGFFALLNLPPGKYDLAVRRLGYVSQSVGAVAPPPGRADQLQPLVIALAALSDPERAREAALLSASELSLGGLIESGRVVRVTVSGRLRYEDGRPAAYVPVRIGNRRATTDGDGVYCFPDLPPGEQVVVAEMPGIGDLTVPSDHAVVTGGVSPSLADSPQILAAVSGDPGANALAPRPGDASGEARKGRRNGTEAR